MRATKARQTTGITSLRRAFREARRLFGRYRHQRRGADADRSNLIAEAHKRLEQLEWLVLRISTLQTRDGRNDRWTFKPGISDAIARTEHERRGRQRRRLGFEIELLSESFYYLAWRLRQIVVRLPGFKSLGATGIRDVRNHLLEHPEKFSKALNPNFMYGLDLPNGPVLKPFGARQGAIHDRGLYANASELIDEMLNRLRRAVEDGR